MIHIETPLWLSILMNYGIYLTTLVILRYIFFHKRGIKYLWKNSLFDFIILILLDLIIRISKIEIVYLFILLLSIYLRGKFLNKDILLKSLLIEAGFMFIGFLCILLPDFIDIYSSVGHIW